MFVVELIIEALIGQRMKSSAIFGQKRVKREYESRGLVIPILDIIETII